MDKKKCEGASRWFQIVYRIVSYVKTKWYFVQNGTVYYMMDIKKEEEFIN